MEAIYHQFNVPRGKSIIIDFLGDIHRGAKNHDKKLVQRKVDLIANNPTRHWVGTGDYIDAIVFTDAKRFDITTIEVGERVNFLQSLVQRQCDEIIKLFAPIKHKCLGLLEGNHEDVIRKRSGVFDPMYYLCKELGVKSLGYDAIINVSLQRPGGSFAGRQGSVFSIYAHHGHGGGRNMGSKVNRLMNLAGVIEADCYVMGHVHDKVITESDKLYVTRNKGNCQVRVKKLHYMLTGSFLHTYQQGNVGYAERAAFPNTSLGSPWLKLTVNKNWRNEASEGVILVEKYM